MESSARHLPKKGMMGQQKSYRRSSCTLRGEGQAISLAIPRVPEIITNQCFKQKGGVEDVAEHQRS